MSLGEILPPLQFTGCDVICYVPLQSNRHCALPRCLYLYFLANRSPRANLLASSGLCPTFCPSLHIGPLYVHHCHSIHVNGARAFIIVSVTLLLTTSSSTITLSSIILQKELLCSLPNTQLPQLTYFQPSTRSHPWVCAPVILATPNKSTSQAGTLVRHNTTFHQHSDNNNTTAAFI